MSGMLLRRRAALMSIGKSIPDFGEYWEEQGGYLVGEQNGQYLVAAPLESYEALSLNGEGRNVNEGIDFCEQFSQGGFSDWKLGSRAEMIAVFNAVGNHPRFQRGASQSFYYADGYTTYSSGFIYYGEFGAPDYGHLTTPITIEDSANVNGDRCDVVEMNSGNIQNRAREGLIRPIRTVSN